jgi:hypothetical protein
MKKRRIWKYIPEYEGMYKISIYGDVKSVKRKVFNSLISKRTVKERILKPAKNNEEKGYFFVNLSKNNKTKQIFVHKLVAITFLKYNPNNRKIVIDHKDANKENNSLSNIQIITNRENITKDLLIGSSKYVGVHWNKRKNNWMSRIYINGTRKYLGSFKNEKDAAIAYQKELIKVKYE